METGSKSEIRRENKNKLIFDLIYDMFETQNAYDYEDFKKDLCIEALGRRTQKELKQILYGE